MFDVCRLIAVTAIATIAVDPSLAPRAALEPTPVPGLTAPSAALKGDRLDIGLHGVSCARTHDDVACSDHGAALAGKARKVRVIPAGRLPIVDQQTAPNLQPRHQPQGHSQCASLPPSCGPSPGSAPVMGFTGIRRQV